MLRHLDAGRKLFDPSPWRGLSMDQSFPTVSEATGIPVIDLTPLTGGGGGDVDALAAEVGEASRDWGFFVVVGHGVPAEAVARATAAQRAFFALPGGAQRPPRGLGSEGGARWATTSRSTPRTSGTGRRCRPRPPRSAAGRLPSPTAELVFANKWPEDLPGFKEYAKAMEELAFRLLELIARCTASSKDQTTFIRLNHYPPCPSPDLALGVGRHKDAGALTILGVRVTPVPDSFIINVGDLIQVWSNDRYESAEQQGVAVNSAKERFSMPYFFNPASYTMVEPVEELLSEENPARYNAYNWGDFFSTRKNSKLQEARRGPWCRLHIQGTSRSAYGTTHYTSKPPYEPHSAGVAMDDASVQAPEHRPVSASPVADANGRPGHRPLPAHRGHATVIPGVGTACHEWGFFVAVGHECTSSPCPPSSGRISPVKPASFPCPRNTTTSSPRKKIKTPPHKMVGSLRPRR
ncbi:hypothetical protein HU200_048379 [Digitaria exilis]|uniref:Fe2OG dioxygenase domain-containing protein n=1 Tax=Digitaria exilis TaxID=1010633 RepID=A0A835ASU1_9POAL|nr:hypothetical protein HU200_048379 [Digitaria exilis]